MTRPLRDPLHAMPMSMSPSVGSARACRRERLCTAPAKLDNIHLSGDAAGTVATRLHTGAACKPAASDTPLPESP